MEFEKFVQWAFMAIVGGGVAWSARFLAKIAGSISVLNAQVATIIERTAWHQKEIESHETRIQNLEKYDRRS